MLANLAGKLRASVRDELLHDSGVREDVADEKIAGFCACNLLTRRDNVHRLISSVYPNGDGIKPLAFREVGDGVRAHDLKWL
jgi:hypothetical protein